MHFMQWQIFLKTTRNSLCCIRIASAVFSLPPLPVNKELTPPQMQQLGQHGMSILNILYFDCRLDVERLYTDEGWAIRPRNWISDFVQLNFNQFYFFLLKNKLQTTKKVLKALLLFYCFYCKENCPAILKNCPFELTRNKMCPFLMKCFCKPKFNMSDCMFFIKKRIRLHNGIDKVWTQLSLNAFFKRYFLVTNSILYPWRYVN